MIKHIETFKMSNCEQEMVDKLKSSNITEVHETLLKIRKSYVRNNHKMKKLQKYSIIQEIIPFLEHPKFCNVSLSIIADGCLEFSFVSDVIKYNGIKSLMRIMNTAVNDDVQNRACRALGNMAKFDIGFKAVHLMKPISNIVKFLAETSDVKCQQTAVRTLMILGKSSKTRELIARENGIVHIAKLLHSSNLAVLICSIKALANLTQSCSILCAKQLLELHLLKVLVELHSHSEKSIRNNALISLKNLSSLEEIRSGLVKVGAVKLFTEVLSECKSHEMSRLAALALCNCLDHFHMWSHNGTDRAVGLKALLIVLQSTKFQDIHFHIIASLFPLSFESKITDILLSLDLVDILIKILKHFIERHKCKSILNINQKVADTSIKIKSMDFKNDMTLYPTISQCNTEKLQCDTFQIKNEDAFNSSKFICNSSQYPEKSVNSCSKSFKWDRSFYTFNSITSDYSSSYSPNRMHSPTQRLTLSPELYYEMDVGSPLAGHESNSVGSPVSFQADLCFPYTICLSPVVSSHSDTEPSSEGYSVLESYDNVEAQKLPKSSLECHFPDDKSENKCIPSDNNSIHSSEGTEVKVTDEIILLTEKNTHTNFLEDVEIPKKKLKTEEVDKIAESTSKSEECDKTEMISMDLSLSNDQPDFLNSKTVNENTEGQSIDYHILNFLLQLSFHLEKKINSQIADKSCFSTIMDYLCLIHNPCLKAETVLLNLIKNRYCFEKVIISGFVSEMEEKMTAVYACMQHSNINVTYCNLIDAGKQEAESDYGIGTLSHILVTSEKMGQFYTICAMSKLVRDKSALHKLLFHANGLSLLFNFLSDKCISTRRRVVISLCEIYQSLTKEQKQEKCCFDGTCTMKTSNKCSYKGTYLNVTFSVDSGTQILANREKICENSEYFRALLSGHFLETNATLISLPGISAENLSTVFHFLHGCASGKCCPYITRIPFSVLLELLSDCDRFLLLNVKAFIEDRLCHRLIASTIPKIYKQSKIHNSPALTKKTLEFALSMDTMKKETVWDCFEELIKLEPSLNFLGDVENLFKNILGI